MKHFKHKNNYKMLHKIILGTIILIILITFFLLKKLNNINESIILITKSEIEKNIYYNLTNNINHNLINKDNLKDILIINKNNKDEILYVDFNLEKAYIVLDQISEILTNSYRKIEQGNINISYNDKNYHQSNSIILLIPIGNCLNNYYLYNLGPKIPVKINFIGSVITNLETKVTNYGMNNALVELFAYIEFHNEIVLPFKIDDIKYEYKSLIASMMIEGEVPNFYNGIIEKESAMYKKVIE